MRWLGRAFCRSPIERHHFRSMAEFEAATKGMRDFDKVSAGGIQALQELASDSMVFPSS